MKKLLSLLLAAAMCLSMCACAASVSVEGAQIDDEGHLILSMSDGSTIDAGVAKGEKGDKGDAGADGKDGRDGVDGKDGVGIKKAAVNDSGNLMIRLSDDTLVNAGHVVGSDGRDGVDGKDGRDGANGCDGVDGKDGASGRDGKDGITPSIGDNGNWWIGETDTGVLARENEFIFNEQGEGSELLAYVGHEMDVAIPKQAKKIGDGAFQGNKAICSVTIPDDVTIIGSRAFYECSNLKTVKMPDSEIEIGVEAFRYSDLESIDLSKAVKIDDAAFASTSLKGHLDIGCAPEDGAFFECALLESVKINMIKGCKIGNGAFSACFGLQFAELVLEGEYSSKYGNGLVFFPQDPPLLHLEIETGAFANCPLNNGVVFPDKTYYTVNDAGIDVEYEICFHIGNAAFGSVRTDSFTLPKSLKYLGSEALSKYVKTVTCEATTPPTVYGNLFDNADVITIKVPAGSVNDYKAADGWKNYADKIQPIA